MDLSLSLLLIRFTAGMLLMGHGAQKLIGIAPGPGLPAWTGRVAAMGFRPPLLWSLASITAEFAGGIALAVGFFAPIACALIVGNLFVAIAKAHWAKGLWSQAGGFEYPLLLVIIAVAVGLGGPGRYSVDAALGWDAVTGAIFVPLAAIAVIVDALVLRRPPAPAPREERKPEGIAGKAA